MTRKNERMSGNSRHPAHRKKKGRRHIRRSLIAAVVIIAALIITAFRLPAYLIDRKLMDLGYTEEEVTKIRAMNLTELILTNRYYSPLLAASIQNGSLNTDYLPLYLVMDESSKLTADDFLLYNRLEEIGYETDQLQNLFSSLSFREITPLLVFDYQYNEQLYIDDVTANRENNAADGGFHLNSSYRDNYRITVPVSDQESPQALVNKTYLLSSDYVPSTLADLPSEYSASGIQMTSDAGNAFQKMASAAYSAGVPIYAILGYRSYADQESAYQNVVTWYGESQADSYAARPGASEHQTGLCVNISCVGEDGKTFDATNAFQWVSTNCADYGFILRYPKGVEIITGFDYEPDHYRYVGRDIAREVQESGLTYDEFYALYLADWTDESCRPEQDILDAVYPAETAADETQNAE